MHASLFFFRHAHPLTFILCHSIISGTLLQPYTYGGQLRTVLLGEGQIWLGLVNSMQGWEVDQTLIKAHSSEFCQVTNQELLYSIGDKCERLSSDNVNDHVGFNQSEADTIMLLYSDVIRLRRPCGYRSQGNS